MKNQFSVAMVLMLTQTVIADISSAGNCGYTKETIQMRPAQGLRC